MSDPDHVIASLTATITARWKEFPQSDSADLDALLRAALEQAQAASPEVITVAGTTTRPQVLRLHAIAKASSDTWYSQEWTEFAVSSDGHAWIIYRRRDGEDYAAPYSEGSALPEELMKSLAPCLVMALYGGDSD